MERDVTLHKQENDVLGMYVVHTSKGQDIQTISNEGLIVAWNEANPQKPMCPGLVITEVNGIKGGSEAFLPEMKRTGVLAMRVSRTPS